jgi:hypothetical protein
MTCFPKIINRLAVIAALGASISACSSMLTPTPPNQTLQVDYLSSIPYHPLVYNLDLSTLAYQLYDQSLVWPFDPYYEELSGKNSDRQTYMNKVQAWALNKGADQLRQRSGIGSFRGPGSLGGFPNNAAHDPIIYDYSRISPRARSISNTVGSWTEYLTPTQITATIKHTYICYRPIGGKENAVAFGKAPSQGLAMANNASNILLAFEGGTGDKGERGQPASQSMMGFILVREKTNGAYDLHVVFRGSRSGNTPRAALKALSDDKAKGNPDWITDLGYDRLSAAQGASHVSTIGTIHRGIAQSMKSINPNLFHCLGQVVRLKKSKVPDNIYVTGHSLGGGLAQAFVASILVGNKYGPAGKGKDLPAKIKNWPWQNIKLISYSAPRIGDASFAKALTVNGLQSELFSTELNPVDIKALKPNDASIVSRLLDITRPVGFRVLHSKDPITTEKGPGGKHVGKTVYVNTPNPLDVVSPPDFSAHEPEKIRALMLASIKDKRNPKIAMRYRKMSDISPQQDNEKRGNVEELRKLAGAIKQYYAKENIPFDQQQLDRDLELRLEIARGG